MFAKLDVLKVIISIMVSAYLAQQIVTPAPMTKLVFNVMIHLLFMKVVVLLNVQTVSIMVVDNAKDVIKLAKNAQMEQQKTVVHAPIPT